MLFWNLKLALIGTGSVSKLEKLKMMFGSQVCLNFIIIFLVVVMASVITLSPGPKIAHEAVQPIIKASGVAGGLVGTVTGGLVGGVMGVISQKKDAGQVTGAVVGGITGIIAGGFVGNMLVVGLSGTIIGGASGGLAGGGGGYLASGKIYGGFK